MRFMPVRRLVLPVGVAALGLAVGAALAQSSDSPGDAAPAATTGATTAPQQTAEERMREARRAALNSEAPAAADPEDRQGPPSEEEWQAASKAMEELTPNWWRRFGRGPQDGPGRERMVRTVVTRFRELQRIQQRDPEQYQREVEQLKLEDEVLSLGRRLWRDPQREEAAELKQQLRDRVGQLVDLRIRDREARIARLTATLEKERGRLEADKRNRDAMAERQYEAVVNRRPLPGLPGPGGGPSPGGRRGPGGPNGPGGPPERPGFAAPPPPPPASPPPRE